MRRFNFTDGQKKHAVKVLNMLVREKLFFVNPKIDENKSIQRNPYAFDEELFSEICALQKSFVSELSNIQTSSETQLRQLYEKFCINLPILKRGQKLVQVNNYHGGMEVKAIIPLLSLLDGFNLDIVTKHLKNQLVDNDDIPKVYQLIKNQYELLLEKDEYQDLSFVILESTFKHGQKVGEDMLEGVVNGLQNFPQLTAYLLTQNLQKGIVPYGDTLTSTQCKGYVKLFYIFRQQSRHNLEINYLENSLSSFTYPKYVHFATIL